VARRIGGKFGNLPSVALLPSSKLGLWRFAHFVTLRSKVLRSYLTSHRRACQPALERFAKPPTTVAGTNGISPVLAFFGFSTHMLRGSQNSACPLGTCHFEPSDVAFPLSGQVRTSEKRISELNTWPELPPYGRSAKTFVTSSRTSAGSRSRGLLVLRKKTFILYPKPVLSRHTLTPFSALCFCFAKSASRLCRQFLDFSFFNQIAGLTKSQLPERYPTPNSPDKLACQGDVCLCSNRRIGSDYSSKSACQLSIAASQILCRPSHWS